MWTCIFCRWTCKSATCKRSVSMVGVSKAPRVYIFSGDGDPIPNNKWGLHFGAYTLDNFISTWEQRI